MGLLAKDLQRWLKVASSKNPPAEGENPVIRLRTELEQYAGAEISLTKEAGDADYERLYTMHKNVEESYRAAVKSGKKDEADKVIDKFSSWKYLKGAPSEPGDLHPFPAPEE